MSPATLERGEVRSAERTAIFLSVAREAFQQLAVLVRNSYLHDLNNRAFLEPLARAEEALQKAFDLEDSLRLELVGSEFFANGSRLRAEIGAINATRCLQEEFSRLKVGSLEFGEGVTTESLTELLRALSHARTESRPGLDTINAYLTLRRVTGVRAFPPRQEKHEISREASMDRRQRAIRAYEHALNFIRESMATLDSPAQLNVRRAKRAVQRLVDLSYEEGDGFSLAGMAAIKGHDSYTFNHMVNVCILAIAFGQRLGLKRQVLARLGLCALYHDMGKLHIPLDVLNKTTKLTEEEWAVMGNHTVYAARTLFPLVERDPGTVPRLLTALQHHRGYDGKGYPALRLLTSQGLLSRITAIVDTFDAMTTKRIYQRQFLPDEAMSVLHRGAGTRYDPCLVKAFINCMGVFPIGSTVLLSGGELAVVVESNPDPDHVHQPVVRIVTDRRKALAEPRLLNLSAPESPEMRILRCVDPEEHGINSAHFVM